MAIAASLDFAARTRKPQNNIVSGLTPELAALAGVPLFSGLTPNIHAALAAEFFREVWMPNLPGARQFEREWFDSLLKMKSE